MAPLSLELLVGIDLLQCKIPRVLLDQTKDLPNAAYCYHGEKLQAEHGFNSALCLLFPSGWGMLPSDRHLPWFGGLVWFGGSDWQVLHGHPGFHAPSPPMGGYSEEEVGREAKGAASDKAPVGRGRVQNLGCPHNTCRPDQLDRAKCPSLTTARKSRNNYVASWYGRRNRAILSSSHWFAYLPIN